MRFPYEPRPGQDALRQAIQDAQRSGRALAVEAATGLGKTICALSASLDSIERDGRRLIYVTRTNSQQAQVLRERATLGTDALLVPLTGRRHGCPHLTADPEYHDATPEELARLCRHAKRKAEESARLGRPVAGACPFYAKLLRDGTGPVEALLRAGPDDPAQVVRAIEQQGSCPYEALKALLPDADGVVAPYVFVLDGALRQRLWSWLGTGPEDIHLMVDEAHNLPEAAREHHSVRLGARTLLLAVREAEQYDDPPLAGKVLTTSLLHALQTTLHELVDTYVRGDDGLVPPDAVMESLAATLRVPTPTLARAARELEDWGEIIREDKRSKGRLPRSYVGAVGAFLHAWEAAREAPMAHLVTGGDAPRLEAYLLEPASVLDWLHDVYSSTHMSGTLDVDAHAQLCGIAPSTLRLPSPFRPENLRVTGIRGVTRRYRVHDEDPLQAQKQQDMARALLEAWNGRSALFFPSHKMLADVLEEGLLHGLRHATFVEAAGMTMDELNAMVARFRRCRGPALLVGVLGGRLSEGIDYPGDALEHMIIMGVPYPRPTARSQALIHYFDRRCGEGWRFAVHEPTSRTLRQAIGRLVRGPEDTGHAVILDERIQRFASDIPRLRMQDDAPIASGNPHVAEPDGFIAASEVAQEGA